MYFLLCFTTLLLAVQVQPYILLTANLDDVQNLAKQLVNSPAAEKVSQIWRRATNIFNKEIYENEIKKRAVNSGAEKEQLVGSSGDEKSGERSGKEWIQRRSQTDQEFGEKVRRFVRAIKKAFVSN